MNLQPILILILTAFLFMSCGKQVENDTIDNLIPEPAEQGDLEDYIANSITYGITMLQDVNDCGEANVLISPYSLQTALYMTMNGAAGNTLEEFRQALNTGDFYPDGLNLYHEEIADKLSPQGDNTSFESSNALFYDQGLFVPDSEFQAILESNYHATFRQETFSSEATVSVINDWVSEQTEQRITKVIDKIESDEAIFLINALVFTADWQIGFEEYATQDRTFTLSDGTEISVPTMQSDDQRLYTQQGDYKAVDLPVRDGDYSMTIILPSEPLTIDEFIPTFDLDEYQNLFQSLSSERIQLFLPKFEIATSKNMKDILIDRGMTTAFQSADLNKMGEFAGNPYLSRVLHDAYLKIDEAGIEGAAITTVGVGVESVPPTLNCNRPFVYIVRHTETNVPIFIGKVGDPSK